VKFKIIRVTPDYSRVVVVTPADAEVHTDGAKVFLYSSLKVNGFEPDQFNSIGRNEASFYISATAREILRYIEPPSQKFNNLKEALKFVRERQVPVTS
jgi:hypothetical protein